MTNESSQTAPFSLSELRFYLTRAGVGAGAPFGVAEDFAEAIVFVARMGFDPSRLACASLRALASGERSRSMAYQDSTLTSTDSMVLSSLFAAGPLCDRLGVQNGQGQIEVNNVDCPLLVTALLCSLGEGVYTAVWPDATIVIRDGIPTCIGGRDVLVTEPVDMCVCPEEKDPLDVSFGTAALKLAYERPLHEGVRLDQEWWACIHTYFQRYLVPSSEEARATAAGAGLVDTD